MYNTITHNKQELLKLSIELALSHHFLPLANKKKIEYAFVYYISFVIFFYNF